MDKFWLFARQLLHYRRILALAFGSALVDALCAFGGLATLMWIIQQLFEADRTAKQIIREKLQHPWLAETVGDLSGLAELIPPDQFWGFASLLLLIFFFAIIGSVGRFGHQYFAMTASLRTVMRIRKNAYQRLVHLPLAVAERGDTADNLGRVVRDTGQLAAGFDALTSKALRNVLQGLVALAVAFLWDWRLAGLFLIGAPAIGVVIRKLGKTIRRAARRANQQYGRMIGAINESLWALPVVKVHQAEGYERRRFNRINRAVVREELSARTAKALTSPVIELIAMIGVMVVAGVAAWLVFRTAHAEPKSLVQVLAALGFAGSAFRPLANLNNQLQAAAAAAVRVDELLQLDVEPAVHHGERSSLKPLPRHADAVRFDHVAFTYPTASTPAVSDIDFEVRRGSTCAIVGGNGAGKSTLVSLLPRLYNPDRGRVLIDGQDIAECSLRSIRGQMAMVTQQTVLFDGTVLENLTYGAKHTTRQRILDAARRAHADRFIDALPDGYDTSIGERGDRLSGGQRQRLALARAILRDPAVLILDEATSQVDSDSEQQITLALAEFAAERTTFVIAHRMSTVVNADMIVVMESGRIASIGRHHDLLQTSDTYRVLCQTQLAGAAAPQAP